MSLQRVIAVGALVGLAMGLAGCRLRTDNSFQDSRTEEATITEVRIEGDSGFVSLDHSGTSTKIDRTVFYADAKPTARSDRVEGSALILNTACAKNGCDIEYRVHLPSSVKVTGHLGSGRIDVADVSTATLSTDSGQITVATASGDVNATTDSGRVDASDIKGRLNVKTDSGAIHVSRVSDVVTMQADSGSINATSLGGVQTTGRTSSGSISITLSTGQDVKATTDSGRITVTVPSGDTYKVKQSTDNGTVAVKIPTDPAGKFTLDLTTNSGGITVKQA